MLLMRTLFILLKKNLNVDDMFLLNIFVLIVKSIKNVKSCLLNIL